MSLKYTSTLHPQITSILRIITNILRILKAIYMPKQPWNEFSDGSWASIAFYAFLLHFLYQINAKKPKNLRANGYVA